MTLLGFLRSCLTAFALVLEIIRDEKLRDEGRREERFKQLSQNMKSERIANEIDQSPVGASKSDILDRM